MKGDNAYMWKYKTDILKELSNRGYTSTKIRKDKILSQATLQNIRQGKGITTDTINTLCIILRCQPSDIIEIVPTDDEKIKYF
jgi:putative transcriptional regulator